MRAFARVADKGLKFGAHVPMTRNAFLVAIHTTLIVRQAADLRGWLVACGMGFEVSGLWIAVPQVPIESISLQITILRVRAIHLPVINTRQAEGRWEEKERRLSFRLPAKSSTPSPSTPNKHHDDIPAPATAWCASLPPRWWPCWLVFGRAGGVVCPERARVVVASASTSCLSACVVGEK